MINVNEDVESLLKQLGDRLKRARLACNESQDVFSARIGLTRQSYSKMEKGVASIPIGYWLAVSDILDRLQTWQEVLVEREDLFEQFEQQKLKRKRASRTRGRGK